MYEHQRNQRVTTESQYILRFFWSFKVANSTDKVTKRFDFQFKFVFFSDSNKGDQKLSVWWYGKRRSMQRFFRYDGSINSTNASSKLLHRSISINWNARTRYINIRSSNSSSNGASGGSAFFFFFWNNVVISERKVPAVIFHFIYLNLPQSKVIHVNGNFWMTSIRRPDFNRMQTKFNHSERRPKKITCSWVEKKGIKGTIIMELQIRHKLFWERNFKA